MGMRVLWLLSILLFVSAPAIAAADCGRPPLSLLWSYPEEGAREVPVNAELWVLVPWSWGHVTARLDGVMVPFPADPDADGVIHLVPGPLAPEHDYTLRLEFDPSMAGAEPLVRELHFRTGTTTAAPLGAATVGGHEAVPESWRAPANIDAECASILRAQGCIDTGPNTLHMFEASAPGAVGWSIGGFVLPARCGATVRHDYWARGTKCFALRAVGPGGLLGVTTQVCAHDLEPDGSHPDIAGSPREAELPQDSEELAKGEAQHPAPSDDDGCNLGSATPSLPWTALLAMTLWRRRRARRVSESAANHPQ